MKFYFKVYQYSLLLMILWSQHAWFTWMLDSDKIVGYFFDILFLFVAFYYKSECDIKVVLNKKKQLALYTLLLGLVLSLDTIKTIPNYIVVYLPLLVLASDKRYCSNHIEILSKLLGIIVVIGIVPYLLWLIGSLNIDGTFIKYGEYDEFYIVPSTMTSGFRYQSVFLEPGYLGTLCALFLYINNYNLRKYYNFFFLIALLFSLSLAGYMLTIIGLFLQIGIQKKKYFALLLSFGILISGYLFMTQYEGGNNYFNWMIVERLQYDEDKGFSGNNRFDEKTDKLFKQSMEDGRFLFGIGTEEFENQKIEGAGYKVFILHYGIIAYALILLFYWIEASIVRDKRKAFCMCLMLYSSFFKTTNPISYFWLILFFLYINSGDYVKEMTKNKIKVLMNKT